MFGDYQGTRIASSGGIGGLGFTNANATVPTAAMKKGDFSSILGAAATGQDANGNPISFVKGTIYDPLSTTGTAAAPISRNAVPGQQDSDEPVRSGVRQAPATVPESEPADHHRHAADRRLLLQHARIATDRSGRRPRGLPAQRQGQPVRLDELGQHEQDQRPAVPGRSRFQRLQRLRRTRPEPQRPDELHARVEPDHRFGDPRQLHAPGDLPRRAPIPMRICSRSSASAATIRPTRIPRTAAFRSSPPAAITTSAARNGVPRWNTTTSGTSSRTSRSARARTPSRSARSSGR